jgi:porin
MSHTINHIGMSCRFQFCLCWCLLILLTPMAAAQEQPSEETGPIETRPHEEEFDDSTDWYDLDAPTAPDYELDEIFEPHTAMFNVPLIDGPIDFLIEQQRAFEERTGLRVGAIYTQLYQVASGGPGIRSGGAGDLDVLFAWTLLARDTDDFGRLFFTIEERFKFGPIPPSQLRNEIGSLVGTTGAFNDRGFAIRDVFWDQRFCDGTVRFVIGRGAPDDYVGSHRLQSSNFGFFNGNLSGNVTTAFPGHGPLAVASIHPIESFYATVGGANAYGVTTESSIDKLFDEGKIYGFGEVGVTPGIDGLCPGRIAVTGWNMPPRQLNGLSSDWGLSFTIEQYLSQRLWVYGRYGFVDRGVITGVESAWQAALAIDGLLGSPDNITGIGFGYAVPADGDLRDEKSIDSFHLFQVTKHIQFSLGAQLFIDPSNSPDTDVLGVFSIRLRVEL